MIATTATKVVYQGNGSTTAFPITFAYEGEENIRAQLYTIESDAYEELTSDFYVDTTQNVVLYPGYPPGEEPAEEDRPPILPTTQKLIIYRDTPATQLRDLGSKYPLPLVEGMVDHVTAVIQEVAESIGRCIRVGMASDITPEQMMENFAASVAAAARSASDAATAASNASASEGNASASEASAAASAESAAASASAASEIIVEGSNYYSLFYFDENAGIVKPHQYPQADEHWGYDNDDDRIYIKPIQ